VTTATVSLSLVAFVVGVAVLASFVAYELVLARRGREPLFDFRLLRYIGFCYGLLTVSVVALGEFGILFILSLYLQEVRDMGALDTGLLFLPFAGGAFLSAPIAGALSRVGPKWVISTGMLLEAAAIFLISRVAQPPMAGTIEESRVLVMGGSLEEQSDTPNRHRHGSLQ
jgi:predicted MFS family arabinose efflux permease